MSMYGEMPGDLSFRVVAVVSKFGASQWIPVVRRDPRSGFRLLPPPASLLPHRSAASVAPVTKGGYGCLANLLVHGDTPVDLSMRRREYGCRVPAKCPGRRERAGARRFFAQMIKYGELPGNLSFRIVAVVSKYGARQRVPVVRRDPPLTPPYEGGDAVAGPPSCALPFATVATMIEG
jgi:hypothetical protein